MDERLLEGFRMYIENFARLNPELVAHEEWPAVEKQIVTAFKAGYLAALEPEKKDITETPGSAGEYTITGSENGSGPTTPIK